MRSDPGLHHLGPYLHIRTLLMTSRCPTLNSSLAQPASNTVHDEKQPLQLPFAQSGPGALSFTAGVWRPKGGKRPAAGLGLLPNFWGVENVRVESSKIDSLKNMQVFRSFWSIAQMSGANYNDQSAKFACMVVI